MPLLNKVVDLSHFNHVSSFEAVKADGIVGVVHKASQGTGVVDPFYAKRRPQAVAAGLLWGAYHFGTGGDVQGQVDNFMRAVGSDVPPLLVLDFEPNPQGSTMTLAGAEAFVQKVKERTGRFPGLYSGQSFIRENLGNKTDTVLKNCFLWIARFSSETPKIPPAFPKFTLWQYTDGAAGPTPHEVNGIGHCDRDKFNGEDEDLLRLFGR